MPREITRVDPGELLARLVDVSASDDTADLVLANAAQVLLGEGLAGFEVDAVVERSGVGRSTVYRRFGDRNGLITATLAHEGRRLLTVLAQAVEGVDDPVEQFSVAFCAGFRVARSGGLVDLVRTDPLLLRLLTVDGAPILDAARAQLMALARLRFPAVDETDAARTAEVLVRLAVSFVLTPESALDLDGPDAEAVVRRHLAPLVAGVR